MLEREVVRKMSNYIIRDKEVCHGKPVFKGTRVLVSGVPEMLKAGMSVKEILEEYPQLTEEMIEKLLIETNKIRGKRKADQRK